MNIRLLFLIPLIYISQALFAQSTGNWDYVNSSNDPEARHENAYVQAGDKFYLIGGRGIKPVQAFDPDTEDWTTMSNTPIELHHFQAIEYGGYILLVGAFTGSFPGETPISNIYIFDPLTDTWILGPQIPASRRRGSGGTVVYNDEVYLVCGIQNGHSSGWVKWLDKFDPKTNTWTQLQDAPIERDHFFSVVVGDKLYNVAGRRTRYFGSAFIQTFNATNAQVDVYDFATDSWTQLPSSSDIPTQRAGAGTGVLGNEIIVAGGESGSQSSAHDDVEAFNVNTQTWRNLTDLNQGRHGTEMITNNNALYMAAGSSTRGSATEQNSQEVFTLGAAPDPDLTPLTTSNLSSSSSPVDFGEVGTSTAASLSFYIFPTGGTQGILIQNSDISGGEFSYDFPSNFPIIIPAGDSLAVTVHFESPTIGSYTGSLDFEYGNGDFLSIPLAATTDPGGGGTPIDTSNSSMPCTDLFISEYLEGSSSNKAIELYNPGNASVNLSNYEIWIYSNGSTTISENIPLSGTIEPGGVFIIADQDGWGSLTSLADLEVPNFTFSGNDAVLLVRDTVPLDLIGIIGNDPGTEWIVGSAGTKNHTLIRNDNVSRGTLNWSVGVTQWEAFSSDHFGHLGYHDNVSCDPVNCFVEITCPADIIISTDTGLCSANLIINEPLYQANCGLASLVNDYNNSSDASDVYPKGLTELVWTLTDSSANTQNCTQLIEVQDLEAPQVTCPPDIEMSVNVLDCDSTFVEFGPPVRSDNCGILSVINDFTGTIHGSDYYPSGYTYLTWIVTDLDSLVSSCIQEIHIYDSIAPVISCPEAVFASTDTVDCFTNLILDLPIATDNCGILLLENNFNNSGNASGDYPPGLTEIVWTATDFDGMTAQCINNVTVNDNTTPSISCPPDTTVLFDLSLCDAYMEIPEAGAIDLCGSVTLTNSFNGTINASGFYPAGISEVTWTAIDDSGNSSQCVQLIEIVETLPLQLTSSLVNPTSADSSNGSIDITLLDGNPPFIFSWNTGSTEEDMSGLAAGSYIIVISDARACVLSDTLILEAIEPVIPACSTMQTPLNLMSVAAPNGTNATLSWDSLKNAVSYQAKGRRSGTIPFGQFVTSNTTKNVGGLNPGTQYEWKLRALCSNGDITPFSSMYYFTTGSPVAKMSNPKAGLFPNPIFSGESIQLALNSETAHRVLLRILNSQGEEVLNNSFDIGQGLNRINIDPGTLSAGQYFFEIRSKKDKTVLPFTVIR